MSEEKVSTGKRFKVSLDEAKHQAERAALGAAVDVVLKRVGKDRQQGMIDLTNEVEKVMQGIWPAEAYAKLREDFKDPNSKWMRYANKMFDNVDPHVIKMQLLNMGYEGGFRGFQLAQNNAEKYGVRIPWIILMDPTSACNLHCTGCWAAEYGHQYNLSFEDMDSIITQGKELGIHAYLMTGGEPTVRKNDIVKLAKKHQDCAFHLFTNGTLIDDEFAENMRVLGNIVPSVSVEGFAEANDGRRGEGVFDKVMHAFDIMRAHKCLFGTSICYTSVNYKVVTSDEFMQMLADKGAMYSWYFHYMPVGNDASPDLLLNPEQREYMYHRIREVRSNKNPLLFIPIDFQNDGEYVHGCVAGGKYYCHINPIGDVEPCVFIHYSNMNIHDHTLLECLQQPIFKSYQKRQPFNTNDLRPCPMLENPAIIQQIVKESGAHSTDMTSPEPVEHLSAKCINYAMNWKPMADKLWKESQEQHRQSTARGDALLAEEAKEKSAGSAA